GCIRRRTGDRLPVDGDRRRRAPGPHQRRGDSMHPFRKLGAQLRAALTLAAVAASAPVLAQATQGVTDTEIVIGTHQDLSGPVAALGGPLRDGMLLAVED